MEGLRGETNPWKRGVYSRPLTFTDLTFPVSPLEAWNTVICHCADRNLNHLHQGFSHRANNPASEGARPDIQHSPVNTAQFSIQISQSNSPRQLKTWFLHGKFIPKRKPTANLSDGVMTKEHFWIWKVLCPAHKYQESTGSSCVLQSLHAWLFLAVMEQMVLF